MLLVKRTAHESLTLRIAGVEVVVTLADVNPRYRSATLGIVAPKDVEVVRSELLIRKTVSAAEVGSAPFLNDERKGNRDEHSHQPAGPGPDRGAAAAAAAHQPPGRQGAIAANT